MNSKLLLLFLFSYSILGLSIATVFENIYYILFYGFGSVILAVFSIYYIEERKQNEEILNEKNKTKDRRIFYDF